MLIKKLKPIQSCSYCLRVGLGSSDPDGNKWEIDHVIPRTKYAGNNKDLSNLVKSCARCNLRKSNKLGVMPRYGSLYADGTIHNKLKEEKLMLMIEDEYEICLAPKNITDISINQAAHMHSVSMDTIRRAIHNRQINGVYKVKDKNGLRYLFPQDSAKKLWRIADSTNSHNEEILEINQLRKEINYLKQIINAIVNLEDK